jgi:hypothetical protein
MKGVSWQSILAGIVVVVAIVGVSLIMLLPLSSFDVKKYWGLEPILGTPSELDFVPSDEAPPDAEYAVVVVECNGDCREKIGTPDSVCRAVPGLGAEWQAFTVDCEEIDTKDGPGTRTFDQPWDGGENGWCKDSDHEDMTVICIKKSVDNKALVIDCDPNCKKAMSPDDYCDSNIPGSHAIAVDCEEIKVDSDPNTDIYIRDFTTKWDSGDTAWCVDDGGEDMTVTCTDEAIDQNYYKVIVIDCKGDCKSLGQSPDSFCKNTFEDDNWGHAIAVDCSRWIQGYLRFGIDIKNVGDATYTRYFSEIWGDTKDDGSVEWCEDGDAEDMTITCHYMEPPKPECNDGMDNDGDTLTDYPDDTCCKDANDNSELDHACCNGVDDDVPPDGLIDLDDPGCEGNPDKDDETDLASYECSDGVDNSDNDGYCDLPTSVCTDGSTPGDPGCDSATDNDETNPAPTAANFKVIVHECDADTDNDCRKMDKSPDDICYDKIGGDWYAVAVDCENIRVDEDDSIDKYDRTFDQTWSSYPGNGWCVDGGDEDMTVICSEKDTTTTATLANFKTVVIDCSGDCRDTGKSPDSFCGSGWYALTVDCESIDIKNEGDGIHVRDLNDPWNSGTSKGWCEKNGGEDMTVTCIDRPIDLDNDVKVVVIECDGTECRDKNWSPDSLCEEERDGLGPEWHALAVDCENINTRNAISDWEERNFADVWKSDNDYGWCMDDGGEDMTVTCVKDSFSFYYYP